MTKYYRLINKNGGYTWIQSCATLISNSLQPSTPPVPHNATDTPSPSGLAGLNAGSPASQHGANSLNGANKTAASLNSSSSNLSSSLNAEEQFEQSIICINYVISRTESENVILDTSQLPDNQNKLKQQRSLNKLQLTHSPPSPPLIQPPAKKMVSNSNASKRAAAANLQSSHSNLASPNRAAEVTANSSSSAQALAIIKQSPSNSPCQSPLRHSQLLPIHHNSTHSTHSDEDVPCNNENNHNSMNSVELLSSNQQSSAELKRRRYVGSSSPVRPWKNSPSPISSQTANHHHHHLNSSSTETSMTNALLNTQHLLLGANNQLTNNSQLHAAALPAGQTQLNPLLNGPASLTCSSPESVCSSSSLNGSSMANSSNLLRHISVIRETPQAILKPSQLVSSAYHHQHQNYSSALHSQHSQLHGHPYANKIESPHHSNHLMTNIQHQQLSHELTSQLTNGHSSNLIAGHHSTSPVDHLGHLAGITAASSNGMAQHLIQQSTNAPSTSSLLGASAPATAVSAQSPFHQQNANNLISSHHNHHSSSLLNGSSQALNATGLNAANSGSSAAEQHATLMHQALTANHHLAHANYTNHLTNQLTHGHHAGLVDPYLPYNAAAAAAALHNWYN